MRAFSDNEDLALLSGINPERVVVVTWIIATALAVIAGTLYGLDKSFRPFLYFQLLLPIAAAAVVGDLGNLGRDCGRLYHRVFRGDCDLCLEKGGAVSGRCRFGADATAATFVHRLQIRGQLLDPDHRAVVHADRHLQGEMT